MTNQKGEHMVNAKVNWRVTGGNGQLAYHADNTDSSGSAYADWKLGASGEHNSDTTFDRQR